MAKFEENYYDLTEDEIQELIAKAQAGDSASQLELLKIFKNFMRKYVNLLYYGKYNLSDYDMRWFISIYVTDKRHLIPLRHNKLSPEGKRHVQEVVRGILYMVQRYGDEEDVNQSINAAFLDCLMRYKRRSNDKGAIPFKGYLYRYFLFVLKRYVDMFLIDQIGRKTFPLIDDTDLMGEDQDSDDMAVGFMAPPTDYLENMMFTEKVDEYWVVGDTAQPPFDALTIQERQLLRWRYVDAYKASDIAFKITEHPNTLREHFTKIRQKLKKAVAEDLGLEYVE